MSGGRRCDLHSTSTRRLGDSPVGCHARTTSRPIPTHPDRPRSPMPRGAREITLRFLAGAHRRGLLRHRRWRTGARVDRQGGLRSGRGLERHLLRHGLRRQRPLHPAGRGRRPRRGDGADHPHGHVEHAHPRHRLGRQTHATPTCSRRPSASWSSSRSRADGRPTPVPAIEPEDERGPRAGRRAP